jgi:Domain of unknown function (DUF4913)
MTLTDVDAADLDARLRRLEETVEDLGDALAATPAPAPASAAKPAAPNPVFPTLDAWVAGWFGPTFGRRLGSARWCATWWRHPEAVVRLEALWRSWEVLRLDPAFGMATWLREHFDPQRAVLFGDDGPFQACDGDAAHHPPPPLPVQSAPPGWTTRTVGVGTEVRGHAAADPEPEEVSA